MKYATATDGKAARAYGRSLPISFKKSIEISNFIRGNKLATARQKLERVMKMKQAVPYRRYAKGGTGHKRNIGPGRYPIKTCAEFIRLLKSAEANAQQKGLDASKLYISAIVPKKAAGQWHYGRKRRRKMKVTHVEIIAQEKTEERKND